MREKQREAHRGIDSCRRAHRSAPTSRRPLRSASVCLHGPLSGSLGEAIGVRLCRVPASNACCLCSLHKHRRRPLLSESPGFTCCAHSTRTVSYPSALPVLTSRELIQCAPSLGTATRPPTHSSSQSIRRSGC
uniref:Uncharacterized protein n=1 Tax=Ascaris lumbricoides TaxID=6252 RepID=A0A0M3HRV0_ASCLU